jgi:SAM-dependent methyltransferase
MPKEVPAEIYDKNYYLTDNEGCKEYREGLDTHMHPKFERALKLSGSLQGKNILDIGCGRGELLYYCVLRGARALGVDYSAHAIQIADETISRLPPALRANAQAAVSDACVYDFPDQYDVVFILEMLEHLTEEQLKNTFKKVSLVLKKGGMLIISTPNIYYEKYLSPLKRFFDIPFKIVKIPLRILRGKYRPKNSNEVWHKIFCIWPNRGEINKLMHVNVITPAVLRKLLKGFKARVYCQDPSMNPLSLLAVRWWGRDIVAVAIKP